MRFRTIYGILMLAGVWILGFIDYYFFPSRPLSFILMTAVAVAAWIEFSQITGISGKGPSANRSLFFFGMAAVVYFFALAWLSPHYELPEEENWMVGGIAGLILGITILVCVRGEFERHYRTMLEIILGVILLGVLLSYQLKIYKLPGLEGPLLWAILIGGIKGNDSAAYFIGKAWGKHSFVKVSPRKTLEGCLGAIAFSMIYWAIAGEVVHLHYPESLFPWTGGMLFGVVISVTSQVGDLGESLIKRVYQVKDSSKLLPEFGGVLDLVDSLTLSSFLFWCLR